MRIAIIDDQQDDRVDLSNVLIPFLQNFDFDTELSEFNSGEDFLRSFEPDQFDICFLDIYMNGINGMDVAKIIAKEDPECFIVFLTTSPDFMAQGYDVRAWRYLLKPLTKETLSKALMPCIEKIVLNKRFLTIKVENTDVNVSFSKLYYITVVGRNVELHLKNDYITLSSKISFSEISKPLLSDFRFVLCDKGTVVNLLQIKSIDNQTILMKNGQNVYVSRRKLPDMKKAFLNYTMTNI